MLERYDFSLIGWRAQAASVWQLTQDAWSAHCRLHPFLSLSPLMALLSSAKVISGVLLACWWSWECSCVLTSFFWGETLMVLSISKTLARSFPPSVEGSLLFQHCGFMKRSNVLVWGFDQSASIWSRFSVEVFSFQICQSSLILVPTCLPPKKNHCFRLLCKPVVSIEGFCSIMLWHLTPFGASWIVFYSTMVCSLPWSHVGYTHRLLQVVFWW